ncbi:alpha/beta hydrolase [Pedobacter antarcticus]|uniref:alpha/beta hydrolase n=1 Tax=Pedobacter antarcticus TaxID=34086 RepID=UPI002931B5A2|nr:alpha/beta hydrolase-fold protein [Pedobacter antarcticus]
MKKIIFSIALLLMFHIVLGQNKKDASKPFVLGTIENIKSVALSENRTLNIYLPEGYNPKDSTRYPVVYLLDGSADEDFIQIVGLYHYNSFPWINRVPKSIIVGIANVDRKRDFTYPTTIKSDQKTYTTSGHSDNFIGFIEKELQPYIEKRYHTNSSKTIIGQSLGGLVATEILLKKPKLFNSYIIISPSLWWDNGSLFGLHGDILDKGFNQETKIYIGVGKEGLAPAEAPHVMEVDANLLAEKIKGTKSKNLKVYFDYLPDEDHATVTHQAVFNALRLLNPKRNDIK